MHDTEKEGARGLSATEKYTITAIILAIVTTVEVLVLYPPLLHASDPFKIALLVVLGTLKFVVVVAFFMHLWNDSPLFTGIFGLGMILGVGTLVTLVALIEYYPKPANAVKAPPVNEIIDKRYEQQRSGAAGHHSMLLPGLTVPGVGGPV